MTWQQAGDQVARLAAGLLVARASSPSSASASPRAPATSGSSPTSRSCAPAAPTTTVYPSTNAEDTAYILGDSECRVVFAEDDEQIAKLTRAARPSCPHLSKVVTFDGTADGDWVIGLDDLAELGDAYLAEHPDVIEETAHGDRRPTSSRP